MSSYIHCDDKNCAEKISEVDDHWFTIEHGRGVTSRRWHFCSWACLFGFLITKPSLSDAVAHACYRCSAMTTLGTAWCQKCLDEAREERLAHPPMKPRPRPRLPSPRRSAHGLK